MESQWNLSPELLAAPAPQSSYGINHTLGPRVNNPEKVASEFEAIFYRMLFKQMRESQLEDPLFGGFAMDQLKETQHNTLASHLADAGHLGIKEMVQEEMNKQASQESPPLGLLKPVEGRG